jgi:ribonuclease HI
MANFFFPINFYYREDIADILWVEEPSGASPGVLSTCQRMATHDTEGQSQLILFLLEPYAPIGVAVFPRTAPHYLLLTQAQSDHIPFSYRDVSPGGVWRFVLEEIGGIQRIEVSETEPGVWGERLQLLAVVRGLEALEQPSRVTLITPSRFVGNGIRSSLAQWRDNHWRWENFGEMTDIKNADLWKRIDQALRYHQLDCRVWDFDSAQPGNRQSQSPCSQADQSRLRDVPKGAPAAQAVRGTPGRSNNRITFEQLQQSKDKKLVANHRLDASYRIKPIGRGRAFGLYDAAALSTVSFTG